ncbi:MAG: hypothetical protein V7606_3752 [Burkholderiales bacterium]
MATTSNAFARKKKNRLSATRPLRPAKLNNLFLRGALLLLIHSVAVCCPRVMM